MTRKRIIPRVDSDARIASHKHELKLAAAQPLLFAGRALPISAKAFDETLDALRLKDRKEALWALLKVETSGCGFLADRRPKILFERHAFSRATHRRFDAEAPDISSPMGGGYSGGSAEYERLARAMALDSGAALHSASWGIGQIMGSNCKAADFETVEEMVKAFCESEDSQLNSVAAFLQTNGVAAALAAGKWDEVARIYNGVKFNEHDYDGQLRRFTDYYATNGTPDIDVRQAQLALLLLGYVPAGSVDGVYGQRTDEALARFAHDQGTAAPAGNRKLAALGSRLRQAAGWA